jgi:hypothetical protein
MAAGAASTARRGDQRADGDKSSERPADSAVASLSRAGILDYPIFGRKTWLEGGI